jgi:formamidopyrimidine-DNA glycosylase
MPELPEVEVLVRHLSPLLKGRTVRGVEVRRAKVIAPTSARELKRKLTGATFTGLTRRGKYLLFQLRTRGGRGTVLVTGHLGMTGRMYLQSSSRVFPKHAAVVLNFGRHDLIYEDQRYFGRFTLGDDILERLGPEPFSREFSAEHLAEALKGSRQAVKVRLLDQRLVAGIGNIYASEILFRAGISPRRAAGRLKIAEVRRLWRAVRGVLAEAIAHGSTVPLNFEDGKRRDGIFYYGRAPGAADYYEERLRVYDRAGKPCFKCGAGVKRVEQAARSTYFCPKCQR